MLINLDYASQQRPEGIIIKPFCYAVDDSDAPDGGSSVRDANYARFLVEKFTCRLVGEYDTCPPSPEWKMVFRIILSVENVRKKSATYNVKDYQRFAFEAIYNKACQGYFELYKSLRKITEKNRTHKKGKKEQ